MFDFLKKLFSKSKPETRTVWLDKPTIDDGQPTTYEEAIVWVVDRIQTDTVTDPYYHHSGGRSVRNTLGLWNKESPLYQHMLSRFGLCHADDTGSLISSAAHALKNGLTYDPEPDVQRFKQHWRSAGFDPATMDQIAPEPSGPTELKIGQKIIRIFNSSTPMTQP